MTDKNTLWNNLIEHERQKIQFGDITIVVENGVFTPDPKITHSASMIIKNLPDLKGLSVADIGTGSGVIAVIASLHGAQEVIATDVSDLAVQNTLSNVLQNGVSGKVKVIKTSLFAGIDSRFDIICANLPILEEVWDPLGIQVETTIESFLKQAQMYLKPGGKIFLPWASFGDKSQIDHLIEKYGYSFNLCAEEKLGHTWYLYTLYLNDSILK